MDNHNESDTDDVDDIKSVPFRESPLSTRKSADRKRDIARLLGKVRDIYVPVDLILLFSDRGRFSGEISPQDAHKIYVIIYFLIIVTKSSNRIYAEVVQYLGEMQNSTRNFLTSLYFEKDIIANALNVRDLMYLENIKKGSSNMFPKDDKGLIEKAVEFFSGFFRNTIGRSNELNDKTREENIASLKDFLEYDPDEFIRKIQSDLTGEDSLISISISRCIVSVSLKTCQSSETRLIQSIMKASDMISYEENQSKIDKCLNFLRDLYNLLSEGKAELTLQSLLIFKGFLSDLKESFPPQLMKKVEDLCNYSVAELRDDCSQATIGLIRILSSIYAESSFKVDADQISSISTILDDIINDLTKIYDNHKDDHFRVNILPVRFVINNFRDHRKYNINQNIYSFYEILSKLDLLMRDIACLCFPNEISILKLSRDIKFADLNNSKVVGLGHKIQINDISDSATYKSINEYERIRIVALVSAIMGEEYNVTAIGNNGSMSFTFKEDKNKNAVYIRLTDNKTSSNLCYTIVYGKGEERRRYHMNLGNHVLPEDFNSYINAISALTTSKLSDKNYNIKATLKGSYNKTEKSKKIEKIAMPFMLWSLEMFKKGFNPYLQYILINFFGVNMPEYIANDYATRKAIIRL